MDRLNVPQPDIHLRILPEYGGQSGLTAKQYGSGAPELIVEITHSSRSRDFGLKKELYARTGVREYITVETASRTIIWRQLVDGAYQDQTPASDGILRSQVFPGLWLCPADAWDGDILPALELGLQSPEHAAFVERLASQRG
jgi:Uma2 family endonuclease